MARRIAVIPKVAIVAIVMAAAILGSQVAMAALPSWEQWSAVQEGWTREQVEALLGAPEEVSALNHIEVLGYGVVTPVSEAFPRPVGFFIYLTGGKVMHKEQPFEDNYSLEGAPSVPKPVSPSDGLVFFHFPRYLDLRWQSSSGEQPVHYELRVQATVDRRKNSPDTKWFGVNSIPAIATPHQPISFVGTQPGRWAVRAVNRLGKSEWSEWQTFYWENRK